MNYVIEAGIFGYILVLFLETFIYRKNNQKRRNTAKMIKRIFRYLYMAMYLTLIMLDVITITTFTGNEMELVIDGWLFILIIVWNMGELWHNLLWCLVKSNKKLTNIRIVIWVAFLVFY